MNIKAAYYAFSRMLLPTITIIGLVLLSTLSIETTFGFLIQKTWLSGILRVALLAIELVWFYYLYIKKYEEIVIAEASGNLEEGFLQYGRGRIDNFNEFLKMNSDTPYSNDTDIVRYKKLTNKVFLVKLLK